MADTKILGIGELSAKFKKLAAGMQTRGARVMVAAGGAVLKAEAKQLAQSYGFKKTGALIKNIAIKRETKGVPPGTTQYNLGVRHGRNLTKKQRQAPGKKLAVSRGRVVTRYADDPFYWSFLEFGWIPRGKGQALRGGERKKKAARQRDSGRKIPGRSFIGQALVNKQQDAITAMEARLQRELDKAIA